MPYNGSGTYAAPASTWNPAVTNTAINSTDWIALLADVTTALSTCMLKDGQQTPTANIPMGGFKFTGLAAGSATGNSVRYEQFFPTFNTTGPVNETKTTVASAATPDIWTSVGNVVDYTGTVTATGFAAAPQAGARRTLVCAAAAPFTAGANMLIDGVASGSTYTAIAGDRITVVAVTTTQFRLTNPHTPFVDTYPIAQGSADATKQVRLEVDGLTTATTRVITVPDSDLILPKGPPTFTVFTGSGTWTKPANLQAAIIEVIGGGGGSGGSDTTAGGQLSFSTGASAGGRSIRRVAASSLGATETVTVGAAGTGAAAANANGGSGGTSSFGALCSATGGAGGLHSGASAATVAAGPVGGVGSGGDININGEAGGNGWGDTAGLTGVMIISGAGGNTPYGAGGRSKIGSASQAAEAGTGYGAGAGGGTQAASAAGIGGANGAPGIVIVTEFY